MAKTVLAPADEAIDELLRDLGSLSELDRKRQGLAPGSAAYERAANRAAALSERLMDRFRDLASRDSAAGNDRRLQVRRPRPTARIGLTRAR